VLVIKD